MKIRLTVTLDMDKEGGAPITGEDWDLRSARATSSATLAASGTDGATQPVCPACPTAARSGDPIAAARPLAGSAS